MAQIGLKYLFYHVFIHFDIIVYLVAFLDIAQGANNLISISEQQWRWAIFLSCVAAVFRVTNFFIQLAVKQREIMAKELENEKLQQEIRAMKLENDKKEIENEKLKKD